MRRCEEHPQRGRRDAAGVGDIPESRSDNNTSRCALFGLHHMAGVACFTSEGMPGGDVAILRMRTDGSRARIAAGATRRVCCGMILLLGRRAHLSQKRLEMGAHSRRAIGCRIYPPQLR